ncbi:unnamed protein product [Heligmosomoides polygyrus]|uniref:Cadherin domain-containing protein n=1 Tax=Heligmosomoides polygyrus TaxID=6339 RepID=A0A3P8EAU9_HELPZ|nr:unnamed protein product [Heligmosomoides polygyrus]
MVVSWQPSSVFSFQDFGQNSAVHQISRSEHAPILQISSREGYVPETAVVGTTVRVSPNPQAESLQILVSDEDLRPGMPPATYQYILTGAGATIFAVDQRGFLYLNAPSIDADPPNPSSYQLNVRSFPAFLYSTSQLQSRISFHALFMS